MRKTVLASLVVLAGCASQIMEGFVSRDITEAALQYGPPSSVFDMPDGRRAFQWRQVSSYMTPTTTTMTMVGSPGFQQGFATTTGGQFHQFECLYTLFGERNPRGSYTVVGFQEPAFGC